MNTQPRPGCFVAHQDAEFRLSAGRVVSVSPWPGEITVVDGCVWLTQRGDPADHVLGPGQRWALSPAQGVVIEAHGSSATVHWQARRQAFAPRVFLVAGGATALRRVADFALAAAGGLDRLRAGFDSLARRAASSASRAQGCINSGDSMACGGAVQ